MGGAWCHQMLYNRKVLVNVDVVLAPAVVVLGQNHLPASNSYEYSDSSVLRDE